MLVCFAGNHHQTLMQQAIAVGTAEDAVCAYVDRLSEDVTSFKATLNRTLAVVGEEGHPDFQQCCLQALQTLRIKLIQCEAVTITHHDLLDNAGRTSYLHQVTAIQDEINQCLEAIRLSLEIKQ